MSEFERGYNMGVEDGHRCERRHAQLDQLEKDVQQLREQNRVLDGALRLVLESWVNGRKVRDGIGAAVLVTAQAALTATSQPEPCTNHFSDGSKIFPSRDCCKPATSQEGQHG